MEPSRLFLRSSMIERYESRLIFEQAAFRRKVSASWLRTLKNVISFLHLVHVGLDKKNNIHSLVREYENGDMDRPHNKQWYQSHIWSMVETCFDKLEGIEAMTGESACLGSKKRKNEAISSISETTRSIFGHRYDLIFRQHNNQHIIPFEFGASEVKSKIEGVSSTNFMHDLLNKIDFDPLNFFFLKMWESSSRTFEVTSRYSSTDIGNPYVFTTIDAD